ncbi:hypothetical protein AYI69_g1696 [Smittium culicis]|uniref:Uncharacterized protein n=1 Tax=Smittium culicis TaxID=133412 RepID=A0A1R1YPI1_9FUNG|nr:hypothetical protein AYI69_g1696 [Smittium culicis]
MNLTNDRVTADQFGDWIDQLEAQVSEIVPLPRKQILSSSKPLSETKKLYFINKLRKRLGYERLEAVVITKPFLNEAEKIKNIEFKKRSTKDSFDQNAPAATGGSVQPWYLSSSISSELITIGNLGQVADRWSTLSSLSKLTILFSLLGLGERKLFLVKDDVARVAKLSTSDPNHWIQLMGSMISNVGLNGKMSGLFCDLNNPSNTVNPAQRAILDDAIDKLVAIAKSSPFKFIPREWCYLGTEIRQFLAPNGSVGSYSGNRVTPLSHSSDSSSGQLVDEWGLKINIKNEFSINHEKRLNILNSAMKSATGGLRHRIGTVKPGGYRINTNLPPTANRVRSPNLGSPNMDKSSLPSGIRSSDPSFPRDSRIASISGGLTKDPLSPEISPNQQRSSSGSFPLNSARNIPHPTIQGTVGLGVGLGVGQNRPNFSGFGAVSAIMNNRQKQQNSVSLNQPKNKLGLLTGKKRPYGSSNATPAFTALGSTPIRRRTAEDITITGQISSSEPTNNVELTSGLTGLHRKTRIQFVDMEDSAVLMQEREAAKKELRDKVVEEREAKKTKRKLQIEKKRSSASKDKGSGSDSDSEGIEVELEEGDEEEGDSNDEDNGSKNNQEGGEESPSKSSKKQKTKSKKLKMHIPENETLQSVSMKKSASESLHNADSKSNSGSVKAEDSDDSDDSETDLSKRKSYVPQKNLRQSTLSKFHESSLDNLQHVSSDTDEYHPNKSSSGSKKRKLSAAASSKSQKNAQEPEEEDVAEDVDEGEGVNVEEEKVEEEEEEEDDSPDPEMIEKIFKDANAVSETDKQRIIDFLHGDVGVFEYAGDELVEIVLQTSDRADPEDSSQVIVDSIIFQINVGSGEWKMYKRKGKSASL